MGMDDLYKFEPDKKIIEYQFRRTDTLEKMPIDEFADLLSTDSPAPGGGSVSALCGAMSGALSSMVAALTHGKKGYEKFAEEMESLGEEAQRLKSEFLADITRDTESFNKLMDAMRLPKKTPEEKNARDREIEKATKEATLVPLGVLKRSLEAVELASRLTKNSNKNSISDAGVAASAARSAAIGAYLNVRINLPGIKDEEFKEKTLTEAKKTMDETVRIADEAIAAVERVMAEG